MRASIPLQSPRQNSNLHLVAKVSGHEPRQLFLKRAIDIVGSGLLLVLTVPVIAACGLLVRLQDGGPMIHRRRVIGKYGNFDAFKLRTMRPDADAVLAGDPPLRKRYEINFKLKNDPRVTRLGALLRRTSLDELPQLWNVLCGEMSLVGPRMISPQELARYGNASWIFKLMRPGLTGLWQVNSSDAVQYEQRVAMDRVYVENWSLLTDLKILFKTPLRILRGKGGF